MKYAVLILVGAVIAFSAATWGTPDARAPLSVENHGNKVVVSGCLAEDSCSIDYRADGTWLIKQVTP